MFFIAEIRSNKKLKNINSAVKMYQKTLNELTIPCTYKFLTGFMLEKKADFIRFFEGEFSVGIFFQGILTEL